MIQYLNNILEAVGNTPLVRLNKITEGIEATVLAKLEMLNPCGSVKDRIGIHMIEVAERKGLIKPGYVIVEPTGGNTGIGLALAAVAKGYKIIFTIPDKMSKEKIDFLRAFGAEVIVTPTAVPPDHPTNYIKVAERIVEETPNAFMPNQYFNPANPEAHYKTTGPEIWKQTNGKIDVLVASMGTGGTITGTAKYLKEKNPKIKVIGADPEGSLIHHKFYNTTGEIHTYRVEGIGEDFMPSTLDLKLIDDIIVVKDKDSFLTARRLAKEEGIFGGGSSGTALFAALKIAKTLKKNQILTVILPDTGRNYMSKIYSDEWMREYGFIESGEERILVSEILKYKSTKISSVFSVKPEDSLETAIGLLRDHDISQLPVVIDGVQVGSISERSIMKKLAGKKVGEEPKIGDIMEETLPTVNKTDKILNPISLLKEKNAILVMNDKKIVDIITVIDVINYFVRKDMK